jgi:hypothetical protein
MFENINEFPGEKSFSSKECKKASSVVFRALQKQN